MFLHISENVHTDTPYSFFFFGFLSLCYGAVDAAGYVYVSNTLTRYRSRHLSVWKYLWNISHVTAISFAQEPTRVVKDVKD